MAIRFPGRKRLSRNVWVTSATSFLTDISTDMVVNLVPFFLFNVLGVSTAVIGLIEGVAEATASLLKLFSGWLSDRLGKRKWVAVAGYAISSCAKPFFYFAGSWEVVAAVRWGDRVGKGVRTAPRDALIADSVDAHARGFSFGFQRAADTAGSLLGLLIAFGVVWYAQAGSLTLSRSTFQTIVLISLVPAFLAVLILAWGARDVLPRGKQGAPKIAFRGLGRPFLVFMVIVGLFDLGNASDAFLLLRAQERGMSVLSILGMLIVFDAIYAALATPAGSISDRIGRRYVILVGWSIYAVVYLGFALSNTAWQFWLFYALYGVYYGLAYGTAKALVADLVPVGLRGTAYGTYNATLGLIDFPASLIAGLLWQGIGSWPGFGPSAPFFFDAALALLAVIGLALWYPGGRATDRSGTERARS